MGGESRSERRRTVRGNGALRLWRPGPERRKLPAALRAGKRSGARLCVRRLVRATVGNFARLQTIQPVVESVHRAQLGVGPALANLSVVKNENLVRADHGA